MRTLVCLLSAIVLLSGCGKKGPLVYPDMLVPAALGNVAAQQTGTSMKLSFVLPSRDLAGRSISDLSGVKILKRDESSGQTPGCNSCATDFFLFKTVNLEPVTAGVLRYGSLVLLLDGDVQAGRSYSYRFAAFTRDNREGAVSAPVTAVMMTTPPPPVLQVFSQPTEIHLEFVALPPAEGFIAGYNIYRTAKGEPFSLLPLNREPLNGNRFVDQGLERTATYVYGVRTVVRYAGGGLAESELSNLGEGKLKDDE